jgi:hypothetical protein
MSNYTFPCASVGGLTYSQMLTTIAELKLAVKRERAIRSEMRIAKAEVRQANAEARRAKAIERAEVRLAKLLAKQVGPVGAKAIKANRRPSKGRTV